MAMMERWELDSFSLKLRPGIDSKFGKGDGIVCAKIIGVHLDPILRIFFLTEIKSGRKFQIEFHTLGNAIREAQRLAKEGYGDVKGSQS